jgi:hypothetical protein
VLLFKCESEQLHGGERVRDWKKDWKKHLQICGVGGKCKSVDLAWIVLQAGIRGSEIGA